MSTPDLNEKGEEGPPGEGCLEKEEEKKGNMEEQDMGEIDKDMENRDEGEGEEKETQDKGRVQETGVMRGNGTQETLKGISQVSSAEHHSFL